MSTLNAWDTTDANNNAAPPDGWPENTMQYSEVNNTGRAVQGTIKRYFADINGSLQAAGVADAYTLTLNETGYSAYFQGMYFACEINATNTGASTIDVNGIGVQAIVDRAGGPLSAGEMIAGGIYEFRYDGTQFQVMGTLAGTATTSDLILTNSNDPDLVDTDVALNVGAADPSTAPHLEQGPGDVQSKADATTAAALDLNALGGNVGIGQQVGTDADVVTVYQNAFQIAAFDLNTLSIASQTAGDPTVPDAIAIEQVFTDQDFGEEYGRVGFDGVDAAMRVKCFTEGGEVEVIGQATGGGERTLFSGDPDVGGTVYGNNIARLTARAAGVAAVRSDGNTDTEDRQLVLEHQDGTDRGYVGYNGTSTLELNNRIQGGLVQLIGEQAGGGAATILSADPDATTFLYHDGAQKIQTAVRGASFSGGVSAGDPPTTEAVNTELVLLDLDGDTILAQIGFNTTNDLRLNNVMREGGIFLTGTATAGTPRNLASFDPDAAATLYHIGTSVARTITAATGGFQVNNTSTGAGFERVLTTSDLAQVPQYVDNVTGEPSISPVLLALTQATLAINVWEGVGPSASGEPNIWTALNVVPTDVDWIEVYMYVRFTDNTSNAVGGSVHARANGSSGARTMATEINRATVLGDTTGNQSGISVAVHAKIPVVSRVFDISWTDQMAIGTPDNMALEMRVTGYGWDD